MFISNTSSAKEIAEFCDGSREAMVSVIDGITKVYPAISVSFEEGFPFQSLEEIYGNDLSRVKNMHAKVYSSNPLDVPDHLHNIIFRSIKNSDEGYDIEFFDAYAMSVRDLDGMDICSFRLKTLVGLEELPIRNPAESKLSEMNESFFSGVSCILKVKNINEEYALTGFEVGTAYVENIPYTDKRMAYSMFGSQMMGRNWITFKNRRLDVVASDLGIVFSRTPALTGYTGVVINRPIAFGHK
jgi:hypothetical protein